MDHFDVTPDFEGHSLEITDGHGVLLGHAGASHDGITFEDASGAHTGYAYDFGGVDHIIDKAHHQIGSVDALGAVHNDAGEQVAHFYDNHFGTGPEILNNQNQIIATVEKRLGG
jgi:hypothetical protein